MVMEIRKRDEALVVDRQRIFLLRFRPLLGSLGLWDLWLQCRSPGRLPAPKVALKSRRVVLEVGTSADNAQHHVVPHSRVL